MHEDSEIIAMEKEFWQSMVDKNADRAAAMIADQALMAGPSGTMTMTPESYKQMTREGNWTLESFELSDVAVVRPNTETAIIAYKVHQRGMLKDQQMDMTCADSTTWVRDGESWKCALHTESMIKAA